MFQGFGDGSFHPEDLHQENGDEDEEEELILDGGLPRYASSVTSDLLAVEEGREMTVDEEEEEEVKSEGSLHRKPPPTWEEWKSSTWTGGPEEANMEATGEEVGLILLDMRR